MCILKKGGATRRIAASGAILLALLSISTSANLHKSPSSLPSIRKQSKQNLSSHVMRHEESLQTDSGISVTSRGGAAVQPPSMLFQLGGALSFVLYDVYLRKAFALNKITFPSMMAGCVLLFFVMVVLDIISPGLGDTISGLLTPGAGYLAKWMPVMFVPGLAMLPLAPKIGTGVEVVKVLATVVVGFFFSCLTVAYSVLTIRTLQGKIKTEDDDLNAMAKLALQKGKAQVVQAAQTAMSQGSDSVYKATQLGKDSTMAAAAAAIKQGKADVMKAAQQAGKEAQSSITEAAMKASHAVLPPPPPAPKPYLLSTLKALTAGAVLFAPLSIYATRTSHPLATPIQTIFMGLATISSFVYGARLPPSFNRVVHPLVTSTVATLIIHQLTSMATSQSFIDTLSTYKAGSFSPLKTGAGDLLLFMLGPAVCSFCIPMYSRKKLMKLNLSVVATAALVSSIGGLFGTALFVRLIRVASPIIRLSMLPRFVTTALAMAISQILEGNMAITASVVVMSGIFGATVGARFMTYLGITDPITRGLAIGCSGQGLGVASLVNEVDAFPFAAIGMVLTAVCATGLVSVNSISDLLVNLALGGTTV